MIKFELANPDGNNAEDAVVYIPGLDYVMFNGIQWHLDRVLEEVNDEWVGCVFDTEKISFMQQSASGLIMHSAKIVVGKSAEQQISSMRLTQAAVLLKAAKRASEAVKDVTRLMRSFDRRVEEEFAGAGDAKLGIPWAIQKRRGAVSFEGMKKTLRMVEDESLEIMHEELDIRPLGKRQREQV
jgi:hypothetical protein